MTVLSTLSCDVMIEIFGDVRSEEISIFHLEHPTRVVSLRRRSSSQITHDVIHAILSNCGVHLFITEDLISCETKEEHLVGIHLSLSLFGHLHTARNRHAPSSLIGLIT